MKIIANMVNLFSALLRLKPFSIEWKVSEREGRRSSFLLNFTNEFNPFFGHDIVFAQNARILYALIAFSTFISGYNIQTVTGQAEQKAVSSCQKSIVYNSIGECDVLYELLRNTWAKTYSWEQLNWVLWNITLDVEQILFCCWFRQILSNKNKRNQKHTEIVQKSLSFRVNTSKHILTYRMTEIKALAKEATNQFTSKNERNKIWKWISLFLSF